MIKQKKRKLLLLATFLYISGNHQCFSNLTADEEDAKEILYRELSIDTYSNLPFHDPGDSDNETFRRALNYMDGYFNITDKDTMNWAAKYNPPSLQGQGRLVGANPLNPDALSILHLCFAVSYIWRNGRKGIHRYYSTRIKYYNHVPFEIGYMTQIIMGKYQNVLELYELSVRKEPGHLIGRPHLLFFYKNIMEDCRTIIHMCNMMHEVTRKYRLQQYSYHDKDWLPVKHDLSAKFQDSVVRPMYADGTHVPGGRPEKGIEGWEHEKNVHEDKAMFKRIKEAGMELEKDRQKQLLINQEHKNYYADHGVFSSTNPTSRRTKRWRSNDPKIYGWEPEGNL